MTILDTPITETPNDSFAYCYIPPHVFQCDDLTPSAKILFGTIIGLTHKKGYCWASNKFLTQWNGLSANRVSKLVSKLKDKGFIAVEIIRNDKNQVIERRIYVYNNLTLPNIKNNHTPIVEKNYSLCLKKTTPPHHKSLPSIASSEVPINNKLNNKKPNRIELLSKDSNKAPEGAGMLNSIKPNRHLLHISIRPEVQRTPHTLSVRERVQQGEQIKSPDPPKPHRPIIIPVKLQELMDYWSSLGLSAHRPGSKALAQTVATLKQLFKGTIFNGTTYTVPTDITMQKIKKAMYNYALAATNAIYEPASQSLKSNLRRISLGNWVYNSHTQHSGLIKYWSQEPLLCTNNVILHQDNERLTSNLTKHYLEATGEGSVNGNRNKFIAGANKLFKFYKEQYMPNMNSFNPSIDTAFNLAGHLVTALVKRFGSDNLTPGHLSSEYTYTDVLPHYLNHIMAWDRSENQNVYPITTVAFNANGETFDDIGWTGSD